MVCIYKSDNKLNKLTWSLPRRCCESGFSARPMKDQRMQSLFCCAHGMHACMQCTSHACTRFAGPPARKQALQGHRLASSCCSSSSLHRRFKASMAALPADVKAELEGFLQEAADGEKMVKIVENILDYLKKKHLLWTVKLEPMLVGIHPCNRDGYGVNPQDVLDLIDSIVDVGFVKGKVHAVGVEVESDEVRRWNERLFASANGLLGQLQPEALKITSICGSHTNAALRLFRDQVAHNNELVTTGGRLSIEQLRLRDPAFGDAAADGLTWDVIAASVARDVPDILPLISRSGNTSLQRGEHELQVLRRIHATYTRMHSEGHQPAFANIKKSILASKPKCATSVPHMYTFCLKASGGAQGLHLKETEQFVRAHCPSSRQLGPELWQALGVDLKGHTSSAVACVRHALVKSAYLRQNVSVSDCRKLATNFEKVKEADELMLAVRAMLKEQVGDYLQIAGLVMALGSMDMCICGMVLSLKQKDEKQYRTVQAVAHDFCLVAQELLGLSLPLKWESFAEATAAPCAVAKASSSAPVMLELDEHGRVKNPVGLLAARGYELGSDVRRRVDKTVGKIQEVKNDFVYIMLSSGDIAKEPIDKILGNEWVVFKPKDDAQVLEDLSLYGPGTNPEHESFMMTALIATQLQKLGDQQVGTEKLALQTKPNKHLQALKDIPKGKLILVPTTSKIVHKASGQANFFEVETKWTMDAKKFFLCSSCILPKDDAKMKPLIVPFFFVTYTEDEEEANVKLHQMTAEKGSSIKFPVFKNTKKIAAGDLVQCYKAKESKAPPLHFSPSSTKRSSGQVEAEPKKKAKN